MADTRKKYTKEFKLEAVRMLEAGTKTGREIEKDLGIGSGQVYRWKKLFVEDGARAFPGNGKPRDAELAELRKENKNLREERDILRKAVAIFSPPDELPAHGRTYGEPWYREDGQSAEGVAKRVLRMCGSAPEH